MNYLPRAPFSSVDYKSESNTSMSCDINHMIYFQNLIGVLHWIVRLGRIDIIYKVSSPSKFLAKPQTGHIYQALHIFKYLEAHISNKLSFDPLYYMFYHFEDPDKVINEMKEVYYIDAIEDLMHQDHKEKMYRQIVLWTRTMVKIR